MSVKLNSSGGGSVTLQEPSTASALTLTLPTTTGTAVIQNASNNLLMNSGYGSDAVAYGCRAWVNFNGTGTVAIRASGNVTSLTDNGTGDYTVNLTTAMPDANYAVVTGGKQDDTYNDRFFSTKVVNTSSFRMYFAAYSIGLYDPTYAHAAIFR
jgi:hypothetical protein